MTTQSSKSGGVGRFRLVCLVFLLVGAGVFYFATVKPMQEVSAA
jgi:hypothetical protein